MKTGDRLQVVKHFDGSTTINFCAEDKKLHKVFTVGDAVEALKYLLLSDEGRKAKDEQKHETNKRND